MSFRDRLMSWLDRGPAPELDPDELVEVEDVWLHDGPMLLHVLEAAGIPAQGIEGFDIATRVRSRMRIAVRRADAARALAALQAHRRRLRKAP